MVETKQYPVVNGTYLHYKGGKYEVISLAKHTETGEDMVVYQSLLFGTVFTRPLEVWNSPVEGKKDVKRFELFAL